MSSFKERLREVLDEGAAMWVHEVGYRISNFDKYPESPIEHLMLAAFAIREAAGLIRCGLRNPDFFVFRGPDRPYDDMTDRSETVAVFPQAVIGDYRVDFVIQCWDWKDKRWTHVVVECDGHEFHERTKEQAEKDKSRDRVLTAGGYKILRFTGREVWRDALGCVEQALKVAYGTNL